MVETGAGRQPRTVVDGGGIASTVRTLADGLSENHDDATVMVAVLKGSVVFLSDLLRGLAFNPIIDFLAVSSYSPGSERVRLLKDLDQDVGGRDVVLVTDVVDTALSLNYLLGELERRGPASLEVCALLDKPARRIVPVELHHVGLRTEEEYLIGYGLGFAGRYRNLPLIAAADLAALGADPDCYADWAYGGGLGRGDDPAPRR